MKSLVLIPLLAGCCSTIPLKQEFPEVPVELMERPAALSETPIDANAEKVFETIIENYSRYHQLSDKYLKWQLWYENQKKIYTDTK